MLAWILNLGFAASQIIIPSPASRAVQINYTSIDDEILINAMDDNIVLTSIDDEVIYG